MIRFTSENLQGFCFNGRGNMTEAVIEANEYQEKYSHNMTAQEDRLIFCVYARAMLYSRMDISSYYLGLLLNRNILVENLPNGMFYFANEKDTYPLIRVAYCLTLLRKFQPHNGWFEPGY